MVLLPVDLLMLYLEGSAHNNTTTQAFIVRSTSMNDTRSRNLLLVMLVA